MQFKSNFFNYIKPYLVVTICFLSIILLFEIVNVGFVTNLSNNFWATLGLSLICNLSFSAIYAITLLPVYALLFCINKKIAFWLLSLMYSFLLLFELSLSIYTHISGGLLGSELITRPIEEQILTIKAAIGLWQSVLIIIASIATFLAIAFFLLKIKYKQIFYIIISVIIVVLAIFAPILSNKTNNITATNKTYYLISDIFAYKKSIENNKNLAYDEEKIDNFLSYNQDYKIFNKEYPLEREDNIPDVLSEYFADSDTPPDIVMIVVESLGMEHFTAESFVPFLDSLSREGLFWSNCLSTTLRSYGAVPALTGSLPSPRGFQFGNMPKHNSIISLLRSNNYYTRAFYGGDFAFDCIQEYLLAQDLDYFSPFYKEYINGTKQYRKETGFYWGYCDGVMFEKTFQQIKKDTKTPSFNLIITLSMHEDLKLYDEKIINSYSTKACSLISKLPVSEQSIYKDYTNRYAAAIYTDDCIRKFINNYKTLPNYKNTIFVITGDHANGISKTGTLDFYNVPLIIWSPLLKQAKHFPSLVTHNDVAPTLIKLLQSKYNLKKQKSVHYIGKALDTSANLTFNNNLPFVNYSREIREMVYNNLYYCTANQWQEEGLYKIKNDLSLERLYDDKLKSEMKSRLDTYKYIYNYVYLNDKLTQGSYQEKDNYVVLNTFRAQKEIKCITPSEPPSKKSINQFDLLSGYFTPRECKKVRINLIADIFIIDSLWIDEYMDISFNCSVNNDNITYKDKICKFFNEEIIRANHEYQLNISKEFLTDKLNSPEFSVLISSPRNDNEWVANTGFIVKNYEITIEGLE